ncbi:hypothetical protein [Glycomyces sp. NPDC048151]|uniref:hypothetical protein n=1 Tax=Glycomyces sp. NPDC048151 TaxID=3364002 RepID=UPI003718654A
MSVTALLGMVVLSGCGGPPEAGPAADGTDYTACEDGACEVAVSEPMDRVIGAPHEGMATLTITAVIEDGIEFEVAQSESTSSGSLSGICESTITANSMFSTCFDEGVLPEPAPWQGELVVQLLGMNDGAAVLRLAVN